MARRWPTIMLILSVWAATLSPALADAIEDFYRGKTVTIQVGTGVGGGYDTTARLVAQTLGKHIPGHPAVVVQNMPGGGGMNAANALFNTAPRDGTALGDFSANVILEPLYGNEQARYLPTRFEWIGSMDSDIQACGVWKGAGVGIHTLEDLLHANKTVTFGSTAPNSGTAFYPLFLKNALGAPVKVINGYTSSKEINLAMERGEIDGTCAITQTSRELLEPGNMDVLVHLGFDRLVPIYGKTPPISAALKSPEQRRIAELVFNPNLITRPLAAPPGTPKERVTALRKAFWDTVEDPETHANATKLGMELSPLAGEEVEKMIASFQAQPPEIIKKAWEYTHLE
jgi:tripartite-type tricarboxylate transporter receptor subunit TctC